VTELLLRHGEWDVIDPASASWRYLSFRVERLRDGEQASRQTGDEEIAIVPLGGRCAVESDGERWELGERSNVFAGMPWALYLPRETEYTLSALGDAEVAISGALAEERLDRYHSEEMLNGQQVAEPWPVTALNSAPARLIPARTSADWTSWTPA